MTASHAPTTPTDVAVAAHVRDDACVVLGQLSVSALSLAYEHGAVLAVASQHVEQHLLHERARVALDQHLVGKQTRQQTLRPMC